MNHFDYNKMLSKLMTPEIMQLVAAIREHKGRQDLYTAAKPDVLSKLCEVARIQSAESSNRIENIKTSEARLRALMAEKVEPKNRDEREIAGYRYVLDMVHSSYEHIPVTASVIQQLHRDLYRMLDVSYAGHWKDSDNAIMERTADGRLVTRFVPTSAAATPGAVDSLCATYKECMEEGKYDSLLIAVLFTFDFVSIHPFSDGNGRMSRLFTLLLLYKAGYLVGKYISIEQEIEKTKETYYEALAASSYGWERGENDYVPFVSYMLGVILACYKELDQRVGLLDGSSANAPLHIANEEAVRSFFGSLIGTASKREIAEACPQMGERTLARILKRMQDAGEIEKVGAARATVYKKVD